MARRRRLGRFSEPVHIGRLYIGGKTTGKDSTPKKAISALIGRVAGISGGMTAYDARGIYRSEAQPFVDEPTRVIETFVDAGRSCAKFKRQLRDIASKAAKEGLQESVGVVVQCVGEPADAVFATGARRQKRRG